MMEVFDPYIEVWSQQPTTGTPPQLGLLRGGCAAIADSMYLCCGFDGSFHHNTLHELGVATRKWRGIRVRNPSEGPMIKAGCQMVVYEGKLVLFGGYSIPSHRMQTGASLTSVVAWSLVLRCSCSALCCSSASSFISTSSTYCSTMDLEPLPRCSEAASAAHSSPDWGSVDDVVIELPNHVLWPLNVVVNLQVLTSITADNKFTDTP